MPSLRFSRRTGAGIGAVGVLILIFLILTALSSDSDEDPGSGLSDLERGPDQPVIVGAGEPLLIGVSTALTGADAIRGVEYRDAVVVAARRWLEANPGALGEHELKVVAEDDGCTEQDVAELAARRHVRRAGLVGVIGPQCSAGAEAAIPVYAAAGVVAVSGSATASALTDRQPAPPFFFRTAYRNDQQGLLIGIYVSSPEFVGGETVYLIDDSEAYGRGLAADVLDAAQGEGVDVRVRQASVERGEVDFSDLTATVVAADPDAVIFAGFNPEAGLLLRQLRDAGWDGPFAGGDALCGGPGCAFLTSLGPIAEGAAFSGCSPPLDAGFVSEFRSVHGRNDDDTADPTASFVAHYVDATTALLDALARSAEAGADGSLRIDPGRLRDEVQATNLTGGLSGRVRFDALGDRASGPQFDSLEQFAEELGLVPCFVQDGAIAYFE